MWFFMWGLVMVVFDGKSFGGFGEGGILRKSDWEVFCVKEMGGVLEIVVLCYLGYDWIQCQKLFYKWVCCSVEVS